MATTADIDATIREIARRLGLSKDQVKKDYWLDPFTYGISFTTPNQLAASATITRNFVVQNDSAFVLTKTTFTVTDANNAAIANFQPFGSGASATSLVPITVTLTDSGSGRSLMDTPIPIDTQYGTGQKPFIWPIPKIIDPNSTFSVTLVNLSATVMHVRLAHHGYKVFGNIPSWAERNK